MNVVIKVNNETKEKMIEYYKDKCREKTPPYAIFQAMEEDTVITLYNSGKAMFQGPTAFVDANMWQELSGVTKDGKKEKEKLEKTKDEQEVKNLVENEKVDKNIIFFFKYI